jgi:hypothetical protein
MNREGLAARDRTARNGGDRLNFPLRRLHSLEYLWETAALRRGGVQIMEDGVVRVVLMEDCNKVFIKAVNQCFTNALGELGFTSEWAHCVHHTLVIGKHKGAKNVAIAINIRLPDMLNGSLGLIGVVGAELVENRRTHLMPCELDNFPTNLRCDFLRVGIHSLKVKVRGLERHGTVLEDGGQDVGLDVIGV